MRQECIEVVIHRTYKRHVELFRDLPPTRMSRGKLSIIRDCNGFCIKREIIPVPIISNRKDFLVSSLIGLPHSPARFTASIISG